MYILFGVEREYMHWRSTRHVQGTQPHTHIEKIIKHNEVRVELRSFTANFLKHLIMPNCLEDRTHTEAISNDMHGQLFTEE